MKHLGAVLLVMLLAGCGGPPTHFYTLAAVAPAHTAAGGACGDRPLGVQPVVLPAVLDREAVVRANTPDSLDVSGQDRWAAPLDGMIRRVVAEDLRQRLPPNRVLLPGDAMPSNGADGLKLNIQRFVGNAAGTVTLQADWALASPSGNVLVTRSENVTARAASSSTADVVAAMNQALGELADHVAGEVATCNRG